MDSMADHRVPSPPGEPETIVVEEPMTRRMGAATSILAVRRSLIMVVSALGTAVVARALGATDFGQLAAALATFQPRSPSWISGSASC